MELNPIGRRAAGGGRRAAVPLGTTRCGRSRSVADYDIWEPMRRRLVARLRGPGRHAIERLMTRHADLVHGLEAMGHVIEGRYSSDGSGGPSPGFLVNVWLECTLCGRTAHTDAGGSDLVGGLMRGPCPGGAEVGEPGGTAT